MNKYSARLGSVAAAAFLMLSLFHPLASASAQAATTSRCAADSSYQRLAFWVGDWDVYDTTGAKYASQRGRRFEFGLIYEVGECLPALSQFRERQHYTDQIRPRNSRGI